ncbi:LLM class flavin-dependent oxidoreductase [Bacillus sp. JJ1562]|uniref:LLM class flavin-dependent oxidoreductase n=1 Tax=Bacillus sp. JJ1562 TaxID=3122960 RepID=UPI0030014778
MEIGLYIPLLEEEPISSKQIETIIHAEEAGVSSVWSRDLLCLSNKMEDRDPMYECLTLLSYLSGKTKTIKLGTAVVSLPVRDILLFAKQALSIDFLSNGRLLLGVGTGYRSYEYEYYNIPYDKRYELTESSIVNIKKLWRDSYNRVIYDDGILPIEPRPINPNGPALFIAGKGIPPERIANYVDGWMMHKAAFLDMKQFIDHVKKVRGKNVRTEIIMDFPIALEHDKRIPLEEVPGVPIILPIDSETLVKTLLLLEKMGITQVIFSLYGSVKIEEQISILQDRVIPYISKQILI